MEQIRWKQRFSNLQKAFIKLERGLELFDLEEYKEKQEQISRSADPGHDVVLMAEMEKLELSREGIIQRFEYTFELFILTLQDILKFSGENAEELFGKRAVLKSALKNNLIQDHDGWRKMLNSRNLTSHTYDEKTADEITVNIINTFFPLMQQLYARLEEKYQQ
ncbi:HI0074 family nucleotidyltransferase substrate-binding subunit [Zunongwangia sp. H14]|uniref:HI0074 family nucleotidyltransferase substrate-binding subunit n=1 Tax=Zunongwangia sp. H14 TaxID=3240792 RepID=UPI0035623F88